MIANQKRCRGALLSLFLVAVMAPESTEAQPSPGTNGFVLPADGAAPGAVWLVGPRLPLIGLMEATAVEAPTASAPSEPEVAAGAVGSTNRTANLRREAFRDGQLRFPRVRDAYHTRAAKVDARFAAQGVAQPAEIFFRVFKREQLLEVWARDAGASSYVMINTYPICGTSGALGPKRRKGDGQIPEGFYHIDLFNPMSSYHLSLRLDYPNAVDRARVPDGSWGSDIFIHGGCATVGCVPVTDRWIEEVYLMAMIAQVAGQERIPVHMFPTRLDEDGMGWLEETYGSDYHEMDFWRTLQEGYLAFETHRTVPAVSEHKGRYTFPAGAMMTR